MAARASDGWRWANPREMEAGAAERAVLAAPHIPERARILDLGAGLMQIGLKMKLGAVYTPVDLVRYADATVLADLNDNQFPGGTWDCALALELLEHIHDVPALLLRIRSAVCQFICTYRCDAGDTPARRAAGYFNEFTRDDFEGVLAAAGWTVALAEEHDPYTLFVCR